jgi:hypothetical protein
MKLLNLPAQGTHLLCVVSGIVSHVIGNNIVGALGGKRQREQFHLMPFGECFEVDNFAMLLLRITAV